MSGRPVGGVEAGGTKFVCVVGTGPDDLRAEVRFPTRSPEETLGRAADFFRSQAASHGELAALGIGCFGPVDPRRGSPTWGHVTTTPKPGWSHVDVAGHFRRELDLPVAFDTDVNAAAAGEGRWGAGRGLDTFLYLTVGTGIGGGAVAGGRLLHGLLHPEMGHVRIRRDPGREPDAFPGACPFHGDCLEGLASGPALEARWGRPAAELPDEHPAWELEASYLAQALAGYVLVLSPERIVLGGGVMQRSHLFDRIRRELRELLGGYPPVPELTGGLDEYVVPPELGPRAGSLGALALALELTTT